MPIYSSSAVNARDNLFCTSTSLVFFFALFFDFFLASSFFFFATGYARISFYTQSLPRDTARLWESIACSKFYILSKTLKLFSIFILVISCTPLPPSSFLVALEHDQWLTHCHTLSSGIEQSHLFTSHFEIKLVDGRSFIASFFWSVFVINVACCVLTKLVMQTKCLARDCHSPGVSLYCLIGFFDYNAHNKCAL